jgi:hypothetical protein
VRRSVQPRRITPELNISLKVLTVAIQCWFLSGEKQNILL